MIRSIVRSTLGRFVPAAATVFAIGLGVIVIAEPRGLSLDSLWLACTELIMLAVGFAATSTAVRGRRGALGSSRSYTVAGFLAPLVIAVLSLFVQGLNVPGIIAISVGAGAFIGLLHWAATARTPRPPKPTLEELEAAPDAELARLDAQGLFNAEVLPLKRRDRRPSDAVSHVA